MAFPLQLVLGVLGNATSLALYLAPMETFWGIFKLKSTQQYSGLPYVCTLFNCALWLLYGTPFVKPHSTMLLTINGAGFALELFYLMSFLTFASKKHKVKTMRLTGAMLMAFAMVVVITIFVLHTYSTRQLVAGTLCVALSIVMYASPLSVVRLVISTKSVEYMPFLLSLFNLLNALVWSTYSLVTRDIFIAVPNGVGFILAVVQLTVYCVYRKSKPVSTGGSELPQVKHIDTVFPPNEKVQVDRNSPTRTMPLQAKASAAVDPTLTDQV